MRLLFLSSTPNANDFRDTRKSAEGKQMLSSLIAAFIPTAVIGLAAADFVKDKLYALWPVAVAWIAGGICILVVERRDAISASGKKLEELTPQRALLIGLVQALALWPGVSRSLVTILAALFVGLTLKAAVEFSFFRFITFLRQLFLNWERMGKL